MNIPSPQFNMSTTHRAHSQPQPVIASHSQWRGGHPLVCLFVYVGVYVCLSVIGRSAVYLSGCVCLFISIYVCIILSICVCMHLSIRLRLYICRLRLSICLRLSVASIGVCLPLPLGLSGPGLFVSLPVCRSVGNHSACLSVQWPVCLWPVCL